MTLKHLVMAVLEETGEIDGTENFASLIGLLNNKTKFLQAARLVEREGKIIIIPSTGGRGRKTIYRRNRNSPGYRRRA
jgi:hypothetical protein